MGSLHAIEVVLVVVLAVGPFLALAGAIVLARRRDRAELAEIAAPELPTEASRSGAGNHHQQQENSWC
jgi:hypothetical protein